MPDHDEDGYRGPAQLRVGDLTIDVEVDLGGHLEPLDGKYHWYGRIVRNAAVDAAKGEGATNVALSTDSREPAPARLAEHDAWGNMRITGLGAPPFELDPVEVTHPA